MSNTVKFYKCNHCGNIIEMIHASGVPVICCGEKMQELVPNTSDGANEKHLPLVNVNGNIVTVQISSVLHPMVDEHFIQWIYLETEQGIQRKWLKPNDVPVATFVLADGDKAVAAYEYCNLHGLWKATL